MPTPIWSDPRFAEFFRGAEETIAETRRTRPSAATLRADRLHELILEMYGLPDHRSDDQAAA